jgi:hypothetical protein
VLHGDDRLNEACVLPLLAGAIQRMYDPTDIWWYNIGR